MTGPLDAFGYLVRMVETNVGAGRAEAERPSPRLNDSFQLMRLLPEWERSSRTARNAAPHEMVSGGAETVEPEGP